MESYRKSAHAVYRCEYHFVWVPKYRYKILISDIKARLKEIITELCEWMDVATKIFTITYNEDTQRKECRISKEGISRPQKEILGSSHMGKRIFCKHSGYRFRDNT